jgi:hypothetical protein
MLSEIVLVEHGETVDHLCHELIVVMAGEVQ